MIFKVSRQNAKRQNARKWNTGQNAKGRNARKQNPYPNPHPNRYWSFSVSPYINTFYFYLSTDTHSLYLRTHTISISLHTLSFSLDTHSLYLFFSLHILFMSLLKHILYVSFSLYTQNPSLSISLAVLHKTDHIVFMPRVSSPPIKLNWHYRQKNKHTNSYR